MTHKLFLLASLYISQFIPTTFLIQALPVFMRQNNMSLEAIGFLGLLVLPSGLKFLWSPFIDRYHLGKLGHYRGWIICFQLLLALTTLLIAFIDVQKNLPALIGCLFLVCLFSASQDIATDALAVNILEPHERGLGNAIQSGGNIFGAVLGGGVMLILLEKVGWQSSLICMSVLMFVNLLPILNYSEEFTTKTQKPSFIHSYFQSFISFLSRPKIIPWLLVLLLYMTGDSVTSMMIRPLLVDRGFSLEEIGWILDIFSYGTRMISALVAGLLIVQIGRTKSLMLFGTLAALAILLYIIPAVGVSSIFVIYIVCIIVNATQSMAYTALLSAMMEKCEKSTAATDYTIQVSLMFLGGIGATLVSGTLANQVGYVVVFIVFTFVNLLAILAISKT